LIVGEDIEYADDQEAIKKAALTHRDSGIELWGRGQCVVRLLPAPRPNWNFPPLGSDAP
jgi:hypothetical protein